MNKAIKGFLTFGIPLLILFFVSSCEDPGSVGSDFADRPTLTFDTLEISQTKKLSYVGYSGLLSFIPLGEFSDPLFGDVSTLGLFKPTRTPSVPDSIEIAESFDMKLELKLDSLQTYGDTLAQSEFSIYEVTSDWRGSTLRIDNDIEYGDLVGSFTVGEEDSLVIDVSEQWKEKYKSYYFNEDANADSAYNYEFQGLAVVSNQPSSKISFVTVNQSRFFLINGIDSDTTDTVNIPLDDWGFTLQRDVDPKPEGTFPIHTTLEGLLEVTIPDSLLKLQNNDKNIVRVDLVFYEAREILNSTLPPNSVRLGVFTLNADIEETFEPEYEYQFGSREFVGTRGETETSFQIGITNYVNDLIFGEQETQKLIIGIGSSSGALRSSLLYDENGPAEYRPRIIITSLEN